MVDQPLVFQKKSQLFGGAYGDVGQAGQAGAEPSTCVEAEPYALQVLDDSMAPEFWCGCVVIVDPTGHARDGSYVLARIDSGEHDAGNGEYLLRQLKHAPNNDWLLVPLHDQYSTIKADEQLTGVVGVIVQRAGKRRSEHKRYD